MTQELEYYILSYCRGYMTKEELQAITRQSLTEHGMVGAKAAAFQFPKMEEYYGFENEITNKLVELGNAELKKLIAKRIFDNHKDEVINLCQNCGKLARTPKAKQCMYCGNDWHEK